MSGTLFVVGTPIGNLEDLTDRARRTLAEVGLVAAEDTRRTGFLLNQLGLSRRMLSLFEGNEVERTDQVLAELEAGTDVALVSDAGMPVLSDPGERLVRACAERSIDVRVVPGPSAAIAALAVSGLPAQRVAFEGFLPRRGDERRRRIDALIDEARTIVVFESPKRIHATLTELAERLGGERRAVVARELTKVHEQMLRGTLSELAAATDGVELKGEVVLVLDGAPAAIPDADTLLALARAEVEAGTRKREAAAAAASASGGTLSANEIYRRLVQADGDDQP